MEIVREEPSITEDQRNELRGKIEKIAFGGSEGRNLLYQLEETILYYPIVSALWEPLDAAVVHKEEATRQRILELVPEAKKDEVRKVLADLSNTYVDNEVEHRLFLAIAARAMSDPTILDKIAALEV
ncbi:MAG: hypothetical protein A2V52_03485 [Actinobacteria bacterium RBG_19FT_COMBO_54_7]|uniref:Uncharacterized protein n=1 Tax=Candidatus Solincola sediminis TaxID=1797199 RepID=A0A1F2WQ80_9ACTN|nr:MAG: hypothetical protein A2Y75_00740 [Candidatus Solincola sediminis]OFW61445.1 MAG: hypothetical protein A2W01_09700 [Candidatus Solincola sediminis]OFW66816.1 MAG: hypothetical protein A2V52_03485 [Actinobacteria bacterium RBG_19FT_COMBO_54_7]